MTAIFAVEVILDAVVAVPVKLPLKLFAVIIPTLTFDGSLALFNVPDEILEAFNVVKEAPSPLNELAVMIPVVFIFPVALSTENPFPVEGFCPT